MTDTTPTITPELLRAVAEYCRGRRFSGGAGLLSKEADRLEREQADAADSARIDALAEVFWEARRKTEPWLMKLDLLSSVGARDGVRAGVRAVLAKLDEEKAQPEPPATDPGRWTCIVDAPTDALLFDKDGDVWEHRNGAWHYRNESGSWIMRTPNAFAPFRRADS